MALGGMAASGMSGQPMPMNILLLILLSAAPIISLLAIPKAWNFYGRGKFRHATAWVFAPVVYVGAGAAMTLFNL